MSHEQTERTIRDCLCRTFAEVDRWFEYSDSIRSHRPDSGRWSIDNVLEHIMLTNQFLLLTLNKQAKVAKRKAERGDQPQSAESDLEKLNTIGQRGSFSWERPDHMEPEGKMPASLVRNKLHQQLGECLILLEAIRGGVGGLVTIKMTVNQLGKIDLYQWLHFLTQHAHRHLDQLEEIFREATTKNNIQQKSTNL